ncbi:4-phosphoerythronate dehydrogenase [Legionella fairfieldensis]|uniref:4-phosphoerythronate dehydrogenase n=1 Tax=Legionella fairfieldensis TaxID=45064 RepID=UPI00048A95A0|nr:4-phosphoerythronate dehydrogenase [Legionella fairfieldensis]
MKILADASLPGLLQAFPSPFEITLYHKADEIPSRLQDQEILLCRSTLKVNDTLLKGHSLRYIATASSGTDHIDKKYLYDQGITLIDAKGSNAIAVADYVIATLAFLQKYNDFYGTKAGIIGVGEVGTKVRARLTATGMDIACYDPPKAEQDLNFSSCSFDALTQCDLICIHANLHNESSYPTRNLLDKNFLGQLKDHVVIINASRGGIVNEEALLQQRNSLVYCTDVYNNEPAISPDIINFATLCTPHIAGHSIEAKYAAVALISQKLSACYQLSPCSLTAIAQEQPIILPGNSCWQDSVLDLYNPVHETILLKRADNLALAFQKLRKAHKNRHNFCIHDVRFISKQTRKILGYQNC